MSNHLSTKETGLPEISPTQPDLSIVTPIYNEVESIPKLIEKIYATLIPNNITYEIICVDDGSKDGSTELLTKLAQKRTDLKAVILRRNYGQTAAMAAGFKNALGKVVVSIDADLQNDPADIPRLLLKLEEGYDLVGGWRKNRFDNDPFVRVFFSKVANWVIGKVTGVNLHDYGCSLKAYRSELLADLNLYGELHRFLPALAFIEGGRITEMEVEHHPRIHGKSKYGLGRTFRVLMDLLTVFFMQKFLTRPMHVFGMLGLVSGGLGLVFGLYLTILKFGFGESLDDRPLLILVVVLLLAGLQLFSFGLLAELLMRTYHESQARPIYRIREVVGTNNLH
ncbi:MAG: glycosyltransferase family 2 protein [Microcoleaceae cyanobacterium]